jgi:VWFA-related protein
MTHMAVFRTLLVALCCAAVFAQQTPQPPLPEGTPQFRTSVEVVTAPVTVLDRDGNYVNGLQPNQFHLYDNDKEQNIQVDVSYQPISLVICLQANAHVDSILPQIRNIGNLIEPLVIGDQGEAAVIAFDHRIRVLQDFTNDSAKVTDAIKKISAGSTSSRMIDAVDEAIRMLRSRPQNRRRIVMLVSETRDIASEGRLRESLMAAQLFNVTVYTVDISRLVTTLMAKPAIHARITGRPRRTRYRRTSPRRPTPSCRPTVPRAAGPSSSL